MSIGWVDRFVRLARSDRVIMRRAEPSLPHFRKMPRAVHPDWKLRSPAYPQKTVRPNLHTRLLARAYMNISYALRNVFSSSINQPRGDPERYSLLHRH